MSWTAERLAPYDRAWVSGHGATLINRDRLKVVSQECWPYMPGELARAYLRDDDLLGGFLADCKGRAGQAVRVPFHHQAKEFLTIPPPRLFRVPDDRNGPWALVDITACYTTLSARFGSVLEYRPFWAPPLLRRIGPAFPRSDELLTMRPVRLATWGMLRGPGIYEYRHGQPMKRMRPNRFLSPDLVGAVMHTVHAIAGEAAAKFSTLCGWVVDAAIMRTSEAYAYIAWLAERWGLAATVRAEGPGYVWGPVSRAIGADITADVDEGRAILRGPSNNLIELPERLREVLVGWAA